MEEEILDETGLWEMEQEANEVSYENDVELGLRASLEKMFL